MSVDLFETVPNFSEGRDAATIDALAHAASSAHLLDVDPDPDHHRVVISVAGGREQLLEALVDSAGVAVDRIDLGLHGGVHPRVGAADVIPIVPLGDATLESCRDLARELGARLWESLRLPVYFYGYGEEWTLADIRAGRAQPDLGGPDPHPTAGSVCVGARRPLVAFNVILPGVGVSEARGLARSLRESAGGMRGVMALVFELPGGALQLSMNLVRLEHTRPDDVLGELARLGVRFESPQIVGLCPAIAAGPPASGRVLEGRLGAAVAREGALRCRLRVDEEHLALARRLSAEASGLAQIAAVQEDILGGAERCAALPPVLAAAGVLDPDLEHIANVASRGLRQALSKETIGHHAARVAALDRRLER